MAYPADPVEIRGGYQPSAEGPPPTTPPSKPTASEPCEGSSDCTAALHEHGCYADLDCSACDEPAVSAAPERDDARLLADVLYYAEIPEDRYMAAKAALTRLVAELAAATEHIAVEHHKYGDPELLVQRAETAEKALRDANMQATRQKRASNLKRYLVTDLEIIERITDKALAALEARVDS